MMTRQAEKANPLVALLRGHREQIISDWADAASRLPGSRYRDLPRRNLLLAAGRWLDRIAEVLATGSHAAMQRSLAGVARVRLRQGFRMDEVGEALLMLREIVLTHVGNAFPPGSPDACEAICQLDRCVCRTLASFGQAYVEVMHQELQQQQSIMIASSTALAIENARLYEETRHRLAESESLRKVAAALLEKLELGDVLDIVCTEAQRLTGALGSTVFLLEDGEWLSLARSTATEWPVHDGIPVEGTFTGMVVREGRACLTNNPTGEQWRYPGNLLPTALLAAPLSVKGVVIGALDVVNKPGGFTKDDLRIIGLFADQAAIAIENARLHGQAEQLAVLEERQRLARELHDSVTQSVYSVTLFAEASAALLEAGSHDRAADRLRKLRSTAQEALREMRLLIFELHPPVLEREGLVGALHARLETVEARAGVQTRLEVEGEGRLPIALEEDLYGIAQEALNNVLKHAHARQVMVRLGLADEAVYLQVSDDGVGFDPTAPVKGGLGLGGIRERARRLRAQLAIDSAPGKGTRVMVTVPGHEPDSGGRQSR